MKLILAIVLALCAFSASAEKVKKFDLHKPMEERVFLCLDLKVLEPMLVAAVKGDLEVLKALSMQAQLEGVCGAVVVNIVYKKQLKKSVSEDGTIYTIYEATVDGHTVYVPLKGYEHRGDT